ncbi:MAG TPA: hypothetical protein VLR26_02240 [Frankiaceae bacterium]|nr:hypothetical protein [Frankiaceae bacterium]
MAATHPSGTTSAAGSSPKPRKASKRAAAKGASAAGEAKQHTRSTASESNAQSAPTVATLRLPLFTATVTRNTASTAGNAPHRAGAPSGAQTRRLAFYVGAVALGALEIIEWPVALLVAAGAYVAGRSRDTRAPATVAVAVANDPRQGALADEASD